jgi:hypothetical protein
MVTPDRLPPTEEDGGRIVRFRPRGAPSGWRWPPPKSQDRDPPVGDLAKFERSEPEDDYRHRMTVNALGLVVTVLLVVAGVWLANKVAETRAAQDCFLSGRRNCTPIEVPPIQRY